LNHARDTPQCTGIKLGLQLRSTFA